jgi:hypothetical protein
VDYFSRFDGDAGTPKFFQSGSVCCVPLPGPQTAVLNRLLRQSTAHPLGEESHGGPDFGTGLEVVPRAAVPGDSEVPDPHSNHAIAVPEQLGSRKSGGYIHPDFFATLPHPCRQTTERG